MTTLVKHTIAGTSPAPPTLPLSAPPNGRAEHQLAELAAAVREHESATRGRTLGMSSTDASLYRRLRQICGEPRA